MNAVTRTEQAALFQLRRANTHRRSISASYAQYEHRKAQWIAGNPDASHVEYDRAMQRIARGCGV